MSSIFRPLAPFGVETAGADVECADPDFVEQLKLELAFQGVGVIRGQTLSDVAFVAFLQLLGPLTFTAGETPMDHQPWLNVVSNVGRERPPRSVFHTDTSYVASPPAYTALKAVSLPEYGGETLFSSQYLAFETLPAVVRRRLADVKVLHVASGVSLAPDRESQAWHPLFRRHPISGKTALFLSTPERCQAVSGLSPADSEISLDRQLQIIRLLYRHSIRPYRIYRHHWQPGDIVIWDNRCTMHRANHAEVRGDRVLHRGLVAGEVSEKAALTV